MSVLIKGMNMPEGCFDCQFCQRYYFDGNEWKYHCSVAFGLQEVPDDGEKPSYCPLVEVPTPHGNLIDSSQVMDVEIYDENKKDFSYKSMTIEELLNTWSSVEVPVVIEAETRE